MMQNQFEQPGSALKADVGLVGEAHGEHVEVAAAGQGWAIPQLAIPKVERASRVVPTHHSGGCLKEVFLNCVPPSEDSTTEYWTDFCSHEPEFEGPANERGERGLADESTDKFDDHWNLNSNDGPPGESQLTAEALLELGEAILVRDKRTGRIFFAEEENWEIGRPIAFAELGSQAPTAAAAAAAAAAAHSHTSEHGQVPVLDIFSLFEEPGNFTDVEFSDEDKKLWDQLFQEPASSDAELSYEDHMKIWDHLLRDHSQKTPAESIETEMSQPAREEVIEETLPEKNGRMDKEHEERSQEEEQSMSTETKASQPLCEEDHGRIANEYDGKGPEASSSSLLKMLGKLCQKFCS